MAQPYLHFFNVILKLTLNLVNSQGTKKFLRKIGSPHLVFKGFYILFDYLALNLTLQRTFAFCSTILCTTRLPKQKLAKHLLYFHKKMFFSYFHEKPHPSFYTNH